MKKTTLMAATMLLSLGILTGCGGDTYTEEITGGYYDTVKFEHLNKTDFKLTWKKADSRYNEVAYSKDTDTGQYDGKVLAHSIKKGTYVITCKLSEVRSEEVQYNCNGNGMDPLIMEKGVAYDIFIWYDLGDHKESQRRIVFDNDELIAF